MKTMIDIHMHIIPGVDDGSYDLEMSKNLLFRGHMQGISKVIATPHSAAFLSQGEKVQAGFEVLRDWAVKTGMLEDMLLGCEIRFEAESLHQTLNALSAGQFPSLNGTSYVLTEFSRWVEPQEALQITGSILREGWIPVIAHAERYPGLYQEGALSALAEKGALLQVNAISLSGDMNPALVAQARALLLRKEITFLGSDAHRLDHRPPEVEMGLAWLYANTDRDYADALAFQNAQQLLIGNSKSTTE